MVRPVATKLVGQLTIMDGVRVRCVESNECPVRIGKDKNPDIAGLGELVRGLPEIIIDLLDTAGKSRPIMSGWIERLNDAFRIRLMIGHLLSIVSL